MTSRLTKIISIFKKINKKLFLKIFIFSGVLFLILLAGISSYYIAYRGKIYPNISVAGIKIEGNDFNTATSMVSSNVFIPKEITINYGDRKFIIKTDEIAFTYDYPFTIQKAYNFTRTGNFFVDLKNRTFLLFKKEDFNMVYKLNEDKLKTDIEALAKNINLEPVEPSVTINGDEISVNKGEPGKLLDKEKLISNIKDNFSKNVFDEISAPITVIDNTLSDNEAQIYLERARKITGKTLNIKFEYNNFKFESSEIIQLIDPKGKYKQTSLNNFIDKISPLVERAVQDPKFTFENGKVTEFQPALDGIKIDKEQFKKVLIESLNSLEISEDKLIDLEVPVIKIPSEISTGDVNDFGINELIGRGVSTYYHSIATRVHNVSLAASRINGTLVKPGDTFSFNQTLGEVSGATGYQQAYIISEGRTILGDGGGVCQVSTTLFRALLNAGLPIIERQAHAYRVSYYEQDSPPGLDATVYSPSPDLKFTNDTPGYILIQAKANPKNYSLIFELYGTSDGRVSSISKPVVTSVSAPPPDLYQDDPTLPPGTIKQIDWKAWGAKVTFNYKVTRNGENLINKTFVSNYKPWQAIYLRGTAAQ